MSLPTQSRGRVRMLAVAAAVSAIGLLPQGPAPAATGAPVAQAAQVAQVAIAGDNLEIRNRHSNLCLDDFDWATQPGAEVRQWTCNEAAVQGWVVRDLGTGYAEIRNRHSGLCLDDFNWATQPGAEVRQWTCNGATVQQWSIDDSGSGYSVIVNRHSGLCLDNVGSGVAAGTPIQQLPCDGGTAQQWRLTDPTVQRITYTLHRADNPSADQLDAYARITDAMDRAVARYNRLNNIHRHLNVYYVPGVPTAEATITGDIRFGDNRGFMQEGTALHEMSHTVGVGTSNAFWDNCNADRWPSATAVLRQWDGPNARINCGGSHMWPYGLNYANEYSEENFERHTQLVQAMLSDGM